MKTTLTSLFVLCTFFCFAQEINEINESVRFGNANYHVLKSDEQTKHGPYTIKSYSGNTDLVNGTYEHGKKTGKWTERYYRKRQNLKSTGTYRNDIKVGKWIFYNTQGEIIQEYDFDKKELISSTECSSKTTYEVYQNNVKTRSKLDCPALYIGGKQALIDELLKKISESFQFDQKEKEKKYVKFENFISFLIDENGNLENLEFYDDVKIPNLKKFIETELNNKKGMWIPGELKGEKVKSNVDILLSINLMFTNDNELVQN